MKPTHERFWTKVHKTDTCWLWTGGISHGYGSFDLPGVGRWRAVRAHRFAYEALVGPIPEGMVIDHLCRVKACVNPDHLEPVTQRTNLLRGQSFAAVNAAKTHCVHGHEFTPANTIVSPGRRRCRSCTQASDARRRGGRSAA